MKPLIVLLIVSLSAILLFTSCSQEEPTEIEAAHILFMYKGSERAPVQIARTKEEARKKAEDILKEINDGADFAEMAKKHSDGPSGPKGGYLNKFGKGAMVKPFEDAAFALKKGKMSGVVETPFGYHLIKRIN